MDPRQNMPYFPPPPGQAGQPPPLPPRLPGSPPTGPFPFGVDGQHHATQYHQPSHAFGHQPSSQFVPVPATYQSLQPPVAYQNPYPSHSYQPGAPQNNAYLNSHLPASQQYSTAAPTPSNYLHQSSPSATVYTAAPPNKFQQSTSLFSNTQKVLGSYQDIKNKAKAKLTQYLAQPASQAASQPRPDHAHAQQVQNQSPSYYSSPLAPPANSVTDYHGHGHYTSRPQYGSSDLAPLATVPPQTSQGSQHYTPPDRGQSYTSTTMYNPGIIVGQEHQGLQQPAYSPQVTMPQDAGLHYPTMPQVSQPIQYAQVPTPDTFQHGALPSSSTSPATPVVSQPLPPTHHRLPHPPQTQEASRPPETIQNLPTTHEIPVSPPLDAQIPSSVAVTGPGHYLPPPQPLVNAYANGPSVSEAGHPTSYALDPSSITQPTNVRADAENAHQVLAAPQLPAPRATLAPQHGTAALAIEQISDGLVNLNLQATAAPKIAPLGPEDEEFHEWKRPIPHVADDGKPNATIWECPDQRELDYEADWYCLESAPNFLVCTRCHEMYLSGTPLASSLERVRRASGRCRFNVPRITRHLLPEYLKHNDDGPIRDFMSSRLTILDCKGPQGSRGGAGIKWFKTLDSRLEGFISCEACYEDIVLATSFRQQFVANDAAQPPDATWSCDVCLPFIARSLVKYSKRTPDAWEEWVQAAVKHINLPQCEKKPISPTTRQFMQLREHRFPEFKMCERCYEETVALRPIDGNFEVYPQQPSHTGLDWMDVALGYRSVEPSPFLCSATSLPVRVSIAAANSQKDIGVFYKALETIIPSPHCTEQGIVGGIWYTLKDAGLDSYSLCAACYAGYVETWQLGRFFEHTKGLDSTQAYLCSFQRSAPRWLQHLYRMQEAVETGVWSWYAGFVRKFDGVPECARETQVENRKWHGWDDCTICPECYMTFCKESSPAPGFEMDYDNQLVVDRRMCCLYSPRMRQKWTEACEKGDAGELVEFSRQRHGVYVQTVLRVQMLRQMQELQMMNAMHAGLMSVTYQGIEGMRVVSGTTDGHEHGNSALGWHATEEGATSAAFRNQMQSGMSQANSASTWMTMAQLTMKWKEFE
ncbi:hypothetical protein LX36DRAFT_662530 [Colletotrichum falcatum]|nr:hypothetical protein LX36DRAFT_662530 [Colletotrichum falcatum]